MSDLVITFDDGLDLSAIDRQLDALEADCLRGIDRGLSTGADRAEATAKATSAYKGQSGATRAGTVFYPAGTPEGKAKFEAAYAEVVAHLAGFTGHKGKPTRVNAGSQGPDERTVVGTVPDDYIDKLEFNRAGAQAFLGPTLALEARNITAAVAQASREELQS